MSSLDMLRGLVIVVMALDHVRDFVMSALSVLQMGRRGEGATTGLVAQLRLKREAPIYQA